MYIFAQHSGLRRDCRVLRFSTVLSVNRGSTLALKRSTLDVCLDGLRSHAKGTTSYT